MKKTNLRLLLFAILFLLLPFWTACTTMPEGNAGNGERWFRMNRCNGCHGEKGVGGKGPVIAGLDLNYGKFIKKLRTPNSAIMPSFNKEQVSDTDAADMYLWLKDQ